MCFVVLFYDLSVWIISSAFWFMRMVGIAAVYVSGEYMCFLGIKIRFSRGIGIVCEHT